MLSARDEADDRVRGLRAGADDYLVKPFELEELELRLWGLLRRRRAAVAASALLEAHDNGEIRCGIENSGKGNTPGL